MNNNYQQQQSMSQMYSNTEQNMGQNMGQTGGNAPWFVIYLVLSILELLFCNQITGIIALVFTLTGNSAYENGDFAKSDKDKGNARISLIVGVILGILCCTLGVVAVIVEGVFN